MCIVVSHTGTCASVLRLLHGAGKDFTTFIRQADDVDRNRCDGVEEGYAALRVAPNGATGQIVGTDGFWFHSFVVSVFMARSTRIKHQRALFEL